LTAKAKPFEAMVGNFEDYDHKACNKQHIYISQHFYHSIHFDNCYLVAEFDVDSCLVISQLITLFGEGRELCVRG
jgi:hypothetical protein